MNCLRVQMRAYIYLLMIIFWNTPISAFSSQLHPLPCELVKEQTNIDCHKDGTAQIDLYRDIVILTPEGIQSEQQMTVEFDPERQKIQLKEAYILKKNGKKIPVTEKDIFIRPSQATSNAPGFTHYQSMTIVFPNVDIGDHIITNHILDIKKWGPYGFAFSSSIPLNILNKNIVYKIKAPQDYPLNVKGINGFNMKDSIDKKTGHRLIHATLKNFHFKEPEPHMSYPRSQLPKLLITQLPSWEKIGEIYYENAQKSLSISPLIREKARQIIGKKTGYKAAQALYNWVAQNIHYISVTANFQEQTIPHPVENVLQNGFGDCKDKVALLQAFLSTVGIESFAALIHYGDQIDPPLPTIQAFNHVIIYIPQWNIFADPTDKHQEFGVLSDYNDHLVVLASSEGKIMRTPLVDPMHHTYKMNTKIQIDSEGTIHGQNTLNTSGYFSTSMRGFFSRVIQRPEIMASEILCLTPEGGIGTIKSPNIKNLSLPVEISAEWKSSKSIKMGNQIIFTVPYGVDGLLNVPFMRSTLLYKQRIYPFIMTPGIDQWRYSIALPESYKATFLPQGENLQNRVGTYTSTYTHGKEGIQIYRIFRLNRNIYKAEEQADFEALIYALLRDLKQSIVAEKSN